MAQVGRSVALVEDGQSAALIRFALVVNGRSILVLAANENLAMMLMVMMVIQMSRMSSIQ